MAVDEDREALVSVSFAKMYQDAGLSLARRAASVGRVIGEREVPHMGGFAEALHFHHLCRLVWARNREGRSWCDALDETRAGAFRSLSQAKVADAWQRAYGESQTAAALRFLRATDRLGDL